MALAMAVDLIGNIYRPASGLSDGYFALLLRLEVPDEVVVLWVLEELIGRQGPLLGHDDAPLLVPGEL